eukprot:Skav234875  [mRNA]  locus=scaffold840:357811:358296:- [translate_table: standard]
MSFVQKLGQKTRAAQVDCRDRWVAENLLRIMEACEREAGRGECVAVIRVDPSHCAADEALEHLNAKLGALGLPSYLADYVSRQVPSWERRVQIIACWEVGPDGPEIALKGTAGNCPICYENRPMVALMPCGHTVCQQCQRSQQLRQCPMCRKNLTGATEID